MRKRALVEKIWTDFGRGSVLDVGFGDLQVLDVSVFPTYTGVDVSDVAVAAARERYPQHTFLNANFAGRSEPDVPPADMVLCFDVLIHQFDRKDYQRMVRRLVARTRRVGIVSAYDNPPRKGGPIIAFHEPVSTTLREAGAVNITKVAGYRGVAVMQFEPGA